MSKYQVGSVSFKQTVATGERFIISVAIIDWQYLKDSVASWQLLKNNYKKWGDLIG